MAENAGPSTKSFAALKQSRENKRKIAGNGNNDNMTYAAGPKALKRLKQSKEIKNLSPGHSRDRSTADSDLKLPAELSLYDINDDCLLNIFRMLSLDDLIWVADTCSRFRALAIKAFTLTHSRSVIDLTKWFNDETKTFDMLQITRLLTKFGSLMTSVKCMPIISSLNRYHHQCQYILNLFSVNCCSGNLEVLRLSGFHFDVVSIARLSPLYKTLATLELRCCTVDMACSSQMFRTCHRLTSLDTSFSFIDAKAFDDFHGQLQVLKLLGAIRHMSKVERFLKSQKKLRNITIIQFGKDHTTSYRLLSTVIEFNSEHLESLALSCLIIDIKLVPGIRGLFSKLRSLDIDNVNLPTIDGLFPECKKLHTLKVSAVESFFEATAYAIFPELENFEMKQIGSDSQQHFFEFLLKVPTLRKLVITVDEEADTRQLCEIVVNNLKQLKNIRLREYYTLAMDKYIPLSGLQYIKKLNICNSSSNGEVYSRDWSNFVRSMVSIETVNYLCLTNVLVDDHLIEAIAKFTNLHHLELQLLRCRFNENLEDNEKTLCLKRLGSLSQLSVLKLVCEWIFSHTELINVVNELEKLQSLTIVGSDFFVGCETYQRIIEIFRNKGQDLAIYTESEDTDSGHSYIDIEMDIPISLT